MMHQPSSLRFPYGVTHMSDELSRQDKHEFKSASKDITSVLRGWSYEPGVINVRKIHGVDGMPKVQMRLDLGLLQMEMNGRPDGVRPHGYESLLEYFENQLAEHQRRHGTELGFHLNSDQCALAPRGSGAVLPPLPEPVCSGGIPRRRSRHRPQPPPDRPVRQIRRRRAGPARARAIPALHHDDARPRRGLDHVSEKKYPEALEKIEEGLPTSRNSSPASARRRPKANPTRCGCSRRFARDIRKKLPVNPVTRLQREAGEGG